MANALFTSFVEDLLTADLDVIADTIHLVGVDHADDTPAPATDDRLDDIASAAQVGESGALDSKTNTGGLFDAADEVVSSVSGDEFESFILFDDTPATDADKNLIVFFDTATGLPLTPNGGDITYAWDTSPSAIFSLGVS